MPFDFPDPQVDDHVVNPETGTPYVYDFNREQWVYDNNFNPDLDQRYVQVIGDTMTGPLVLHDDPQEVLGAATKQYVDERIKRSGDTMEGVLKLAGPHRIDAVFGEAGKLSYGGGVRITWGNQTVQLKSRVSLADGTDYYGNNVTGELDCNNKVVKNVPTPTIGHHAVNKDYVDDALQAGGGGGSMPEPNADGKLYGRKNPVLGDPVWEEITTGGGGGGTAMPEPADDGQPYARKRQSGQSSGQWTLAPLGVEVVPSVPSNPQRGMLYLTNGNQLFLGIKK